MDTRSRHYMFGSPFGDFSDRNDIDTYSSNSDTDSDSDWDKDPPSKTTFITPAFVTDYPALPPERFMGYPHIVLTGNPPRKPVLKENEKVNLEHADGMSTYLYYHSPDALKAFLDMNNKFFVFRTEAKRDEQHYKDIILIREANKIILGSLGHRSPDKPSPGATQTQEWRAYFEFTIHPTGKWVLDSFLSYPLKNISAPWQDAEHEFCYHLVYNRLVYSEGASMPFSVKESDVKAQRGLIEGIKERKDGSIIRF